MDSNSNNKTTLIVSIGLHLSLLFAMIWFKSADVIIPSRANGIEVSLMSSADLAPPPIIVKTNPVINNQVAIPAGVSNADINLKPIEKPQTNIKEVKPKPTPVKIIKKTPPKVIASPKPVAIAKPKKSSNQAMNDILKDITPSEVNNGVTTNSAKGGTNAGSSDTNNMLNNYADLVIERVRPYVIIPDGITDKAIAVVQVTLLPSMQVYAVKLIKSSGNSEYDNNVVDAINRVGIFPDLPSGAKFSDYRNLRLVFRPQ